MTERSLPKSAHRSADQKAQGYFGAAHRALVSARYFISDGTDWAKIVDELIEQVNDIPETPSEARSTNGMRPPLMLRMAQKHIDRLQKAADKRHMTRSALARQILTEWLNSNGE